MTDPKKNQQNLYFAYIRRTRNLTEPEVTFATDNHGYKHWTRPLSSRSSRKIALSGRSSGRGAFVDAKTNRIFFHESHLEYRALVIFLTDNRVETVEEQPPAVTYRCSKSGKTLRHTFDLLVTWKHGPRVAYAVKPSVLLEATDLEQAIASIRRDAPVDFADDYAVLSERDFVGSRFENGKLILEARSRKDQLPLRETIAFLEQLHGAVHVFNVLGKVHHEHVFHAIAYLLGEGLVRLADNERLTLNSSITYLQHVEK